jgi:hypothetical protein
MQKKKKNYLEVISNIVERETSPSGYRRWTCMKLQWGSTALKEFENLWVSNVLSSRIGNSVSSKADPPLREKSDFPGVITKLSCTVSSFPHSHHYPVLPVR